MIQHSVSEAGPATTCNSSQEWKDWVDGPNPVASLTPYRSKTYEGVRLALSVPAMVRSGELEFRVTDDIEHMHKIIDIRWKR